jgi:hypothetical protein
LLKITDPLDRHLFLFSTIIQIGDGKSTPFWEARWLRGLAPKELAPNLFLIARFKRRTVQQEQRNNNWIRNLQHISTTEQLVEFTLLFMAISSTELSNKKDSTSWKWSANGKFSVASAYDCQFAGSMTTFLAPDVWSAFSEPRRKFFVWLVIHDRVLTANNMIK